MKLEAYVLVLTLIVKCHSSVYVPGTPGAAWSDLEVEAVREKVLVMVDVSRHEEILTLPPWDDQIPIPCWDESDGTLDCGDRAAQRRPTENLLLRLTFHDCFKYKDGSGGCDGCLNWDVCFNVYLLNYIYISNYRKTINHNDSGTLNCTRFIVLF